MSQLRSQVTVLGAGPAGRAVAAACADQGVHTVLIDPRPDRVWRPTYGVWADELPPWLRTAASARSYPLVRVPEPMPLGREYLTMDNAALHAQLRRRDLHEIAARAEDVRPHGSGWEVCLGDAGVLRTQLLVRATGSHAGRRKGPVPEQTAFGMVLNRADLAPLLGPDGESVFMDWRAPRADQPGTFCYLLGLDSQRVLAEETSLVACPGMPLPELRRRLLDRLAGHGIAADAGQRESVRFPVTHPRSTVPGVAFGTAAGLMHPATGYSVGTALRLAAPLAATMAAELPRGHAAAERAARRMLWPAGARRVQAMRAIGLRLLLNLPAAELPGFFRAFFRLSAREQAIYLSEREDATALLAVMVRLFRHNPARHRLRMLEAGLQRPL